jgi:hypothetical protein
MSPAESQRLTSSLYQIRKQAEKQLTESADLLKRIEDLETMLTKDGIKIDPITLNEHAVDLPITIKSMVRDRTQRT